MEKINRKILLSIFVFFIILFLSISIIIKKRFFNNAYLDINIEKIYYQIKCLDNEIIYIYDLIDSNTNLTILQKDVEKLYRYWNSAILDFNNLKIDNKDLTDFGKILDNLTISIRNQEKQNCINYVIELYNKLIIYTENLDYNENYTNIIYAKYSLLNAYSNAFLENWTIAHEYILECDDYISNVINSVNNSEYNQYNINQAYISIKELENLINIKDFDLFKIKYNTAINKLKNL